MGKTCNPYINKDLQGAMLGVFTVINDKMKHLTIVAKVHLQTIMTVFIRDDISIKSLNVKININDICNLISLSSEHFN
jgi:hypothetical protein